VLYLKRKWNKRMALKPKFGLFLIPKSFRKPKNKYCRKSKLVNLQYKRNRERTRATPKQQIKLSSLKRFLTRHGLTKKVNCPLVRRV